MPRALAIGYDLKRVAQTRRTFENWPRLLSAMFAQQTGRGPAEITFRTRTGVTLICPNQPGARLPAYEQFAEDDYRLGWFLGELRNRPIRALDVGAHVGAFACHLASLNREASVDCFEPSEDTASYLQRNIDGNGFGARVTVHRAAMSAQTGFATFDDNGGASVHNGLVVGDHRLVESAGADGASGNTVQVPTSSFDDYVAAAGPIDFVKMDCEGGEYELVYGSSPESWSSVRRVVMEHHEVAGETWAKLRAWFEVAGLHEIDNHTVHGELGTAWLSRDAV